MASSSQTMVLNKILAYSKVTVLLMFEVDVKGDVMDGVRREGSAPGIGVLI